MALCFTQCKPTPEGGDENSRKVKVSCTIPINNGGRSDFTNLMETGKVNWSEGREYVYVAIHGEQPTIIELEGFAYGNPSKLTFEGEVAEELLTSGAEYDIWYFGHSHQTTPNYSLDGNALTGSIANQSGSLEDLGHCHIAKTTVTAETVNDEVKLNLNGTLKNQIAIAVLNLEGVEELYGSAINGTEYTLAYDADTDRYELVVTEDANANISVGSGSDDSYIVLLPNEKKETKLKCVKGGKTYATTFFGDIKANKIYYRTASDGATVESLPWSEIQEINGHEYVDLGLSSGLLWATCNVGAETPEAYGNYYAWGETETKSEYTEENSLTYGRQMNDISGNAQFDAATANWGCSWRVPTHDELKELLDNCTWEWTTENGINGYKVIGKNGNRIFLPAAGYFLNEVSLANAGARYRSSTPHISDSGLAYLLTGFQNNTLNMNYSYRYAGSSIRPVSGGNFTGPAVQYAFVDTDEASEITANSATCGGNVTTDNGKTVTAKGICWSTSENPTIEDNKTNDGFGTGSFTSELTDLEPNTTYYVRAYATNAAGTSYGEEKSFTTLPAGPDANGHSYVDLGLPSGLLWATCNVGAETPEAYGNYYAWGETEPAPNNNYDSSNCSTYGLSNSELQSQGYIDSNGNLTAQYDAATANWGGDWRMPTKTEMQELINNCTWTWTTQNGVNGYKVTSKVNSNYIFLPAAGYRSGSSLSSAGSYGYYWSSVPYEGSGNYAYSLSFRSSYRYMSDYYRLNGRSVRPVLE